MSDDYSVPYQRRTKKDLRKKREFRVYKKGGPLRVQNLSKSKN
jgi:hypothetical protein